MSKKNIMLVCSAGMSTSMLVKKMQEAAKNKNIEYKIFAVPTSEAIDYIEGSKIDVVLLGPQVRFQKNDFSNRASKFNIPVEVIEMRDYGTMNGKNVLEMAEQLLTK